MNICQHPQDHPAFQRLAKDAAQEAMDVPEDVAAKVNYTGWLRGLAPAGEDDRVTARIGRAIVADLRALGFTVRPPIPRFYVHDMTSGGNEVYEVRDREANAKPVATFGMYHPDPFARATAEAEYLNEEHA